tara:strand:- start:1982 stop:2461 length:480 start_codon:yes stop_codon:yes gene_type:complete
MLSSLPSCGVSKLTEGAINDLGSCSRSTDFDLGMVPDKIFISWATASPEFPSTYRLVPVIQLSGEVTLISGTVDGEIILPKQGNVFLQFWPEDEATNASWTGYVQNNFFFDYPISHVESLMEIVEGPNPFRVRFRERDARCVGLIFVDERNIPFKSKSN